MILDNFFNPGSVAIVGASHKKGKVGNEVLSSILKSGYKGKIFAVNPNADRIKGLKCYKDLKSIGEVPDLVVISIPPPLVVPIMQQCVELKVKATLVLTLGLKESDKDEINIEQSLAKISKSSGIRIIGPNCIGLMSPVTNLNASFAGDLPKPGKIGYFSQSGSILAAVADIALANDLGFSRLVNIGDKADINELDVIRDLGEDPETNVIAGYLESFSNGDSFMRQAERVSRNKPILLIKSGVTPACS